MKKTVITIIILLSLTFGIVWWKISEDKIFSIISGIVGIVAGLTGIYSFWSNNNNEKDTKYEKQLKKQLEDKDKQLESNIEQIKQLKELREYDKEEIEKLYKENDQLRRERSELEKQLEQVKEIIKQNEEKNSTKQSSLYKKAYNYFIKGNIEKALNLLNIENLEKHNDADLWFLKAELFEIIGNYDKVIECYEIGGRNAVIVESEEDWVFNPDFDLEISGIVKEKYSINDSSNVFFKVLITKMNHPKTEILMEKVSKGDIKDFSLIGLTVKK